MAANFNFLPTKLKFFAVETIQERKPFKGGNYMMKYGVLKGLKHNSLTGYFKLFFLQFFRSDFTLETRKDSKLQLSAQKSTNHIYLAVEKDLHLVI